MQETQVGKVKIFYSNIREQENKNILSENNFSNLVPENKQISETQGSL